MLPPIKITAPTRTILNPTDNISELAKKTVMYCVLAVEGTQIPTRQCTECSLPRRNRQSKRRQRRLLKLSHRFQTNDSFATIDLDHSEERPFIRFARKKQLFVQRSASRDPLDAGDVEECQCPEILFFDLRHVRGGRNLAGTTVSFGLFVARFDPTNDLVFSH